MEFYELCGAFGTRQCSTEGSIDCLIAMKLVGPQNRSKNVDCDQQRLLEYSGDCFVLRNLRNSLAATEHVYA